MWLAYITLFIHVNLQGPCRPTGRQWRGTHEVSQHGGTIYIGTWSDFLRGECICKNWLWNYYKKLIVHLFSAAISCVLILQTFRISNENALVYEYGNLTLFEWTCFFFPFFFARKCCIITNTVSDFPLFLLKIQFFNSLMLKTMTSRRIGKCLSHLLRMKSHLMNIVSQWKKMAHGLDTWNCRQHLLLHIVIYAYIGWALFFLLIVP